MLVPIVKGEISHPMVADNTFQEGPGSPFFTGP
jgi:hypothetical protein